ncbi:MAG: flagellar biosynthesis protein FlhF, partial [Lysobacter sp.]
MRIKRFIATDMRSALSMVRAEQGPEAVILSSRATADGIEVVAATDYDEALVQQALRAAAPVVPPNATAPVAKVEVSALAAGLLTEQPVVAPTLASLPAPRDSFAQRARAVFGIGDSPVAAPLRNPVEEPTLAELTAGFPAATTASLHRVTPGAPAAPGHFQAMMAALVDPPALSPPLMPLLAGMTADPSAAPAELGAPDPTPHWAATETAATPVASAICPVPVPPIRVTSEEAGVATLQTVAEPDPGISAMREELTSMRQMIEREIGQFTAERLRGSPGRAAAYDLLLSYGCDEALAQSVAAKLNPALAPNQVRAPMLAELARTLTVMRSEPIDDGGVIALIGPTGAGKTTTVAKLAARFAERHRARDVAMVTTDSERVGAIEQLHAHGRRLGITVCEAHGAESLARTLEQLQDYPLVLVDTAGYGSRDRALLGQITWLRATSKLRSLLVLPANAHPHDLNELVRRYRIASPEGVVLTKTDETGRLGAALSVAVRNGLNLAYTTHGQQVPHDLEAADASTLVLQLEK